MEKNVMRLLIKTGDYCLIKRQFMMRRSRNRLDLLCVTHTGKHLIIYELKRKFSEQALVQAERYARKYKPKACFIIFNEPMSIFHQKRIISYKGKIGVCQFDGVNLICIRKPIVRKGDHDIPFNIMKRLSADYMNSLPNSTHKNQWWNPEWEEYNKKILAENGIKTISQRRQFWRVKGPNISKKAKCA